MSTFPDRHGRAGLPDRVTVYEVGPRDGLQAEPALVDLDTKLRFLDRLGDSGLSVIEATSFVAPSWVPQLADADQLMSRLVRDPEVRYPCLVPNQRGLERAAAAGVDDIAVVVSATERFAHENLNTTLEGAIEVARSVVWSARERGWRVRGYVSMCFGDPWEGPVPTGQVVSVTRQLLDAGCDEVSLGDTIGVATPGHVTELLSTLNGAGVGMDRVALHCHDTYGQALANVLAGLEAGVTTFDASAGGLGGCPFARSATGNLATEELVWMLEGLGIDTGVDLESLAAASRWMAERLGRPAPSRVVAALAGAAN